MSEQQKRAEKALTEAVTLMLASDPTKVARMVNLRLHTPGGMATAQVLIFTESESVAAMVEARTVEPTRAERLSNATGLDPTLAEKVARDQLPFVKLFLVTQNNADLLSGE